MRRRHQQCLTGTYCAAGNVEVRSYSITQTGTVLERRTCSGTDLPTALAATPRVNEVTTDLDGGAGAVQVACRANANAALAPATPAGDEQCRIVTLTVKTRTGFEFELEGHRDMTQSPAASVPNVKKCTLLPGADTWVSTYSAGNNYGRDWRNFTVRRSGYGDWNGEKLAYFMVDLLGACTGPGEPPFLPGGKQIMSAEFQIFLIGSAHVSNLEEHSLTALGDPWDEGLLTAQPELRPGVKSGAISRFFDAWPSNKAYTFQVLDEVNHWYDGSWPNYGWVLARGEGNDGHGTDAGFWWGGRESSDSRHWPKLTLTWR
ncbi:MAG: DNRLRE domain-containing protein [Microthrixaceae bacterium]